MSAVAPVLLMLAAPVLLVTFWVLGCCVYIVAKTSWSAGRKALAYLFIAALFGNGCLGILILWSLAR